MANCEKKRLIISDTRSEPLRATLIWGQIVSRPGSAITCSLPHSITQLTESFKPCMTMCNPGCYMILWLRYLHHRNSLPRFSSLARSLTHWPHSLTSLTHWVSRKYWNLPESRKQSVTHWTTHAQTRSGVVERCLHRWPDPCSTTEIFNLLATRSRWKHKLLAMFR